MRCIVLSDSAQIGCYSNLVLNSDLRWRGFYTTERQRDRETERRGDKETGRQGDFVSPLSQAPRLFALISAYALASQLKGDERRASHGRLLQRDGCHLRRDPAHPDRLSRH